MSIRQFKLLKMFMSESFLPDAALTFDQRTFGSMCFHKWVTYSRYRGFHITPDGRAEWTRVNSLPEHRKYNNGLFAKAVPAQAGMWHKQVQRAEAEVNEVGIGIGQSA